ncbi:MAG: type III-B CRISPR module RAMP protein Cmr6 [Campylobacterota bacterium]|nr:type III-B CRISPR module RAMP protein Cmr6 [Campylobacterota bacterium]
MSNPNLGWLFYKDYFTAIRDWTNPKANEKDISRKVDELIKKTPTIKETEILGSTHFKATTTYPGLLLGSGNAHELPGIEGQAILGFHFDYTSGLPIIQGSSIKGVLRSAFRHWEYIAEIGGETLVSLIDVENLEREIFDNGDIFFDAQIISGGRILGDDYITPHGDDLLKNPIPLRFIKVLPNVTFRFDFELSDGILEKDKKIILFTKIIEDLGVGAKTNVGYGKFDIEDMEQQIKKEQQKLKREEAESRVTSANDDYSKAIALIDATIKLDNKLFKNLRDEVELDSHEKSKVKEHFDSKFEGDSKFKNRIHKILT